MYTKKKKKKKYIYEKLNRLNIWDTIYQQQTHIRRVNTGFYYYNDTFI